MPSTSLLAGSTTPGAGWTIVGSIMSLGVVIGWRVGEVAQLYRNVGRDALDQPEGFAVGQRVHRHSSFLAARQHPCLPQRPEVLRGVLLRRGELVGQGLDVGLTEPVETIDESNAYRLPQHAEPRCDELD